jgi:hypothetical protein
MRFLMYLMIFAALPWSKLLIKGRSGYQEPEWLNFDLKKWDPAYIKNMAKPMNAMMSLGLAGCVQVRSRLFFDEAGALPCLETLTPTNSTVSGNHQLFVSFHVRLCF